MKAELKKINAGDLFLILFSSSIHLCSGNMFLLDQTRRRIMEEWKEDRLADPKEPTFAWDEGDAYL